MPKSARPKSASTPIEFPAKGYLIAAAGCTLLGLLAVISSLEVHQPAILTLAVFWAGVSWMCMRSWRNSR